MQQATEEGHYEHAVETLKSYYKDFFCTQEDVDDVYIEMLESVEQKLKTVINKKKETAVKDEALADIERFALKPLLICWVALVLSIVDWE